MGNLASFAAGFAVTIAVGALAGQAAAAPWARSAPTWVVSPTDAACHSDLELTGRSGAVVEVSLVSDGSRVMLRFAKDEVPARAFLPIRIDQKPYANLVLRTDDAKAAAMVLSEDTLAAMRKGATLQIAWLAEEPLSAPLSGSERGIADLKTCGAQVAAQHRERLAVQAAEQDRAAAEARVKALADEQMAAARAQTAAAEAERRRIGAEAQRAAAEADRLMAEAERQRALAQQQVDQERRQAQAARWDDEQQSWAPYRRAPYAEPSPYRGGGYYDPRYGSYYDN